MDYYGKPRRDIVLAFRYERKYVLAKNRLFKFIYKKLSKYYTNKSER